jgi:cytosine permease
VAPNRPWAIGSVCAFVAEQWMPYLSSAISAAVVARAAYYLIAKPASRSVALAKSQEQGPCL